MAGDNLMDQDEIERLLKQAQADAPADKQQPAPVPAPQGSPSSQSDVDAKLSGAPSESAGTTSKPTATTAPSSGGDDDRLLGQDDIEKLLSQAKTGTAKPAAAPAAKKQPPPGALPGEATMAQGDIDYLLNQAERALESIGTANSDELPQGVASFRLEEFAGAPASNEVATLDLIRDVELDVKIELGRTLMYLEDVLKLRRGSVVPLDKLAGDPVDIYVNGRLIARGEVLVLNDNFCVRVAELIAGTHVLM